MAWAMLARFGSVGEAESARSALEAAGIDVEISDEETVAVNWLYSNAVGGVKLYVDEADREDAEAVISTAAESPPDDEAAPEPAVEPKLSCPACGKTDVVRIPRLALFLFLAIVAIGVGAAVGRLDMAGAAVVAVALVMALAPSHRCTACGERWSASETRIDSSLPNPSDTADVHCARCGSAEVHRIDYRRLKAIPLLVDILIFPVVAIWWALPKWRCDNCGFKGRVVTA